MKALKILWLILKIILAPGWFPLWLFWKLRYIILFFALAGCASTASFDKSPCACEFERLEAGGGHV